MSRLLKPLLWLICVVILVLGGAGTYFWHVWSSNLPYVGSLREYQPPIVTTFYSAEGETIGRFWEERREVVPLDQLPPHLLQAFVAAEDARFFQHEGVDFFSIARAFTRNLMAGRIEQGGSTITQQVTKSLLLQDTEKTYKRKAREAILAVQLEKAFSKEHILFLYVNQIYLGHGAYGVQEAARTYFRKPAHDLNLAESALLAGLPQAPSRYSPVTRFDRARARQVYVLRRMLEEGLISEATYGEALDFPLEIYGDVERTFEKAPCFTEHVRRDLLQKYGREMLYQGGLQVYTNLDMSMQRAAMEAVQKGLTELDKREGFQEPLAQAALLCMDTETGEVKAMVGGRNFEESQFNRAIQSRRQPGSVFKPIIYAAALDQGLTPAHIIMDSPFVAGRTPGGEAWKPKNYKEKFLGPTLLRTGMIQSRNVITVKLLDSIGVDYAIEYARNMGIQSHLTRDLSLALGSSGVSLLEMTRAYGAFANGGYLAEPVFVNRVQDRSGRVIEENQPRMSRAIPEETAFVMTDLLRGVIQEGTGQRLRVLERPAAGKTGTTNDLRDAWFVGYTPELVTGVWVGYDEPREMGKGETGARAASPIWLYFMSEILKDRPVVDFKVPPGVVFARIDSVTGLLASSHTEKVVVQSFKEGTEPREHAPTPQSPQKKDLLLLDMDSFR